MAKSALILIDIQNDYFPGGKWELHKIEDSARNAARLLEQARAAGQMIVHVHHEFKAENPPFFAPGTPGADIHTSVAPKDGEHKVLKHYANAFRETNLQALLADHDVSDVTIAGDMSHMCIDAAARNAADIGLNVTVVEDACSSRDLEFNGDVIPAEQVHKAYMSALSFAYATVVSTSDYLAGA
ncbi:cysteine hydrolase family protein [Ruegeria sp.]|uniref:cysteine hydrolase family protein n=1 Tax=Ruegeria sp. TaxID=1879320 RepID=UPI003B58EF34